MTEISCEKKEGWEHLVFRCWLVSGKCARRLSLPSAWACGRADLRFLFCCHPAVACHRTLHISAVKEKEKWPEDIKLYTAYSLEEGFLVVLERISEEKGSWSNAEAPLLARLHRFCSFQGARHMYHLILISLKLVIQCLASFTDEDIQRSSEIVQGWKAVKGIYYFQFFQMCLFTLNIYLIEIHMGRRDRIEKESKTHSTTSLLVKLPHFRWGPGRDRSLGMATCALSPLCYYQPQSSEL